MVQPFYDVRGVHDPADVFWKNDILLAVQAWEHVHPLLRVIPVEWNHGIPYGLLHSPAPSAAVQRFLTATQEVIRQ